MKVNEPFNDEIKSKNISNDLVFRLANNGDIKPVFDLMSLRNPNMDKDSLLERTTREIKEYSDGKKYGLFVAELNGRVVGFCRFYHSESVPKEKVKHDSPSGYYAMGIIVTEEMRRHGVARFLSNKRFEWLKELGATCIYSCVALNNKTSQRMHEAFGFKKIQLIPGALTVTFDAEEGLLYRKDLKVPSES